MSTIRRRQLAALIEDAEGTYQSPSSAANAKHLLYEPKRSMDIPRFERNPARASLSKLVGVPGIRTRSFTFRTEVAGSGNGSTAPSWALLLRACGFHYSALTRITVGTISGSTGWARGDTITGGTSGATGTLVNIQVLSGTIWLANVTGTFQNGEVLSNGTRTATASTGPTSAGQRYTPQSQPTSTLGITASGTTIPAGTGFQGGTSGALGRLTSAITGSSTLIEFESIYKSFTNGETLTFENAATRVVNTANGVQTQLQVPSLSLGFYHDGRLTKGSGSRGNVKFSGEIGQPAMLDWEFMAADEGVEDEALLSGISYDNQTPPALLNCQARVDNDVAAIDFAQVEFDMSNTVTARITPNRASGIRSMLISNRDPKGSFTPEAVSVSRYDWYTKMINATTFSLAFQIGSTAGNAFVIELPTCEITNTEDTDRDSLEVEKINFGAKTTSLGGDNEVIIDIL